MSDVAERVKKIVVEHLGVEPEKAVDKANFIDDLGADSLDIVELVMAFEEEFGIEIPDDAAETILTVGDAVKFLETAKAALGEFDRRRRGRAAPECVSRPELPRAQSFLAPRASKSADDGSRVGAFREMVIIDKRHPKVSHA